MPRRSSGHRGARIPVTVAELIARDREPAVAPVGRAPRTRMRLRRAAISLVAVLALGAVYYVGLFAYVDNAVARVDALRLNAPAIMSAPVQADADNFLLVGSRAGQLDSAMLVHLTPDRSRGVLVSFPANAYVDVPACAAANTEPFTGSLAAAFQKGGGGCTVAAIQLLTGIKVTHYVQLDYPGFARMVNALDGVPGCAGGAVLDGAAAASVLESDPDPDAAAVARQQQLLGGLFEKVLSAGTILNPVRLTSFLTSAASAVTLDGDTTLGDLKDLGEQLRQLDAQTLTFRTAPVSDPDYTPVGSATSYAILDDTGGRALYDSMIDDTVLPAVDPAPVRTAAAVPGC